MFMSDLHSACYVRIALVWPCLNIRQTIFIWAKRKESEWFHSPWSCKRPPSHFPGRHWRYQDNNTTFVGTIIFLKTMIKVHVWCLLRDVRVFSGVLCLVYGHIVIVSLNLAQAALTATCFLYYLFNFIYIKINKMVYWYTHTNTDICTFYLLPLLTIHYLLLYVSVSQMYLKAETRVQTVYPFLTKHWFTVTEQKHKLLDTKAYSHFLWGT